MAAYGSSSDQLFDKNLDDGIDDFSTALIYLNRSLEALRRTVPQAANGLALKINDVSTAFMDAVTEAQRPLSPLPPSRRPPSVEEEPVPDLLAAAAYGGTARLGNGPQVPPGYEHLAHQVLVLRQRLGRFQDDHLYEQEPAPRHNPTRPTVHFDLPDEDDDEEEGDEEAGPSCRPARTSPLKDKGKGKMKELLITTGSAHGGATGPWTPAPAEGFAEEDIIEGAVMAHEQLRPRHPPGASWASVAALTDDDISKIIPARGATLPVHVSARTTVRQEVSNDRVIWLSPLPTTDPPVNLKRISEALAHCGPLHSIKFYNTSPNTSTTITSTSTGGAVPQAPSCRVIFHEPKTVEELRHNPPSSFPFSGIMHAGTPFTDPWISALDAGARRRLIVVRRALLAPLGEITIEEFVELIEQLAGGKELVEDVTVYNVGNISVTLASVQIAESVKSGLERMAKGPGLREEWAGCYVGYSRDPCEAGAVQEVQAGKAIFTTSAGRIGSFPRGGVTRFRGGRCGGGVGVGRIIRGSRWTTR